MKSFVWQKPTPLYTRFRIGSFSTSRLLKYGGAPQRYSVTVPEEASAYFNVLTAAKKPADVLRWAQMTAARAAAQARSKLMRALLFAQDKGADFPDIDEVNVVTFGMLQRMARQKTGESFEEKRDHFYRSLPKDLDIREAALKECSWLFLQAQMPRRQL